MKFITNSQLYEQVILPIATAKKFVWIGTADIKDMHVRHNGTVQPLLSVFSSLIERGVNVRLLYAKSPGLNFRQSFKRYPNLSDYLEQQVCPRVHFKHVIIDGTMAYTGSANLTGAGLGMKSKDRRNFEMGLLTTNPQIVQIIMKQFNDVWSGTFCQTCGRREFCSNPII